MAVTPWALVEIQDSVSPFTGLTVTVTFAAVMALPESPAVVVPVLLPADQARDARFRFGADAVVAERDRDAVLLLRSGPRAERAALTDALRGRGAVVGPALGWAEVPEW